MPEQQSAGRLHAPREGTHGVPSVVVVDDVDDVVVVGGLLVLVDDDVYVLLDVVDDDVELLERVVVVGPVSVVAFAVLLYSDAPLTLYARTR